MKKEDLIHLRNQLNKVNNAVTPSSLCKGIHCGTCVFSRDEDNCATQRIDNEINVLIGMIDKELNKMKPCPTCGHELDGEE